VKVSQLHQLTLEELQTELEKLKQDAFHIRVRSETEKVENTAEVGAIRKGIARIKTIMKIKNEQTAGRRPEADVRAVELQ